MTGFVIAAGLVVFMGAPIVWLAKSLEWGLSGLTTFGVIAVWMALGIGFMLQMELNGEQTGPCLRWETTMHYNPATKTVMPARHCAERAEWVE